MAPKPPLSHDDIREIRRLRADRYPVKEIAQKYGRSVDTIGRALSGRTYRGVTATSHNPQNCMCPRCVVDRRREENDRRGPLVEAVALCVHCGEDFTTTATALLARPGAMACPQCRGKRSAK